MTTLIDEDFESGTDTALLTTSNTGFTGLSGAAIHFTTDAKRGSLAAEQTGNETGYAYLNLTDLGDLYVRAYLKISAIPADKTFLGWVGQTGDGVAAAWRILTDGTLQMRDGSVATGGASTTVMPVAEWVRVEWHVSQTAGTQEFRIFKGGSVDSTTPTETLTGTYSGTTLAETRIGMFSGSPGTAWQVVFDDVGYSDSGWLGPTTTATTVTVTNPGPQSAVVGVSKSLTMQGSTTGAGSLTWTATGLPDGLAIASGTGIIQGTPTTVQTTTCTITGTDSTSNSDSVTFTWAVASATSDDDYPVHEDFESGTDTNTIGNGDTALDSILGVVKFDNTHTAFGDLAALFDTSSPADRASGSVVIPASLADDFVLRWFVYITDWQKGYLASSHTGVGHGTSLRLNADGTLSPRDGYVAIKTSTTTLPKNAWTRIERRISSAAQTQELRIFTGNAAFSSAQPTETITGDYTDAAPDNVDLGAIAFDTDNWQTWIDNIAVSSDWIGPPGASPAPPGSYVRHMWDGGAWVPTETLVNW